MSPTAEKILRFAYSNYVETGNYYFVYQCQNSNDWYDAVIGAHQLFEDQLIDEVPDVVKSPSGSFPLTLHLDGNITESGIEKARVKWEFKG